VPWRRDGQEVPMTGFPINGRVVIDFRSLWLAGTGGGLGRQADVRCHHDRAGFPALPMSQVKGTLREVADRMVKAGKLAKERRDKLFGERVKDVSGPEPKEAALAFRSEARVDAATAKAFHDRPSVLFTRIASTAIDEAGVAADRTLRSIEAAVPLCLAGRVDWVAESPPDFDWIGVLDMICAVTPAFGKAKGDGYGQAIARAEEHKAAVANPLASASGGSSAIVAASGQPRRLELRLTQYEAAIFSKKSATEGAHQSADAPSGAALLGWCAKAGPYSSFDDPVAVFHSGAVRFHDARPSALSGEEVLPVPRSFAAPKACIAGPFRDGRIDTEIVRNGRSPDAEDKNVQYEGLKSGLMTPSFLTVSTKMGQRLRTATLEGRAETGKLFGFEHVEPGTGQTIRATIDVDGSISEADFNRIKAAFDGRSLHLGRGKNTGYGGEYRCEVLLGVISVEQVPAGLSGSIKILALSDLAPINEYGSPSPIPDPTDFGLTDAEFDPGNSAMSLRRFAPWNAKLGHRDTERQVIEAGSVLAYKLRTPLKKSAPSRQTIGAWREAGFGSVWLVPSFLAEWKLTRVSPKITDPEVADRQIEPTYLTLEKTQTAQLVAWRDLRAPSLAGGQST